MTVKDVEQKFSQQAPDAPVTNCQGRKLKRFLIVGEPFGCNYHPRSYNFGYCEGTSFREVMIAFAKTVDESYNKENSQLYSNIVYSMWDGSTAKYCLELFKNMFKISVVFIGELDTVYMGAEFIDELKNVQALDYKELPF